MSSSLTDTLVVDVNDAVVDDVAGDVAVTVVTTRCLPLHRQTGVLLVLGEPHMPWGRRNYNRTQHSNDSHDTVKWCVMSSSHSARMSIGGSGLKSWRGCIDHWFHNGTGR